MATSTATDENSTLFNYTAGRWLYNESAQNAARFVPFNIEAASAVVCEAVGAASVDTFQKIGEGAQNRVFLLHCSNGKEAVLRIPFGLAGCGYSTVASEVATTEFSREVLGLPAPRVLAWSGDATGNNIGAEYMVLEKMDGVTLDYHWPSLKTGDQLMGALQQLFQWESAFDKAPFSQFGSLYFAQDVEPSLRSRQLFREGVPLDEKLKAASEKYRIGPLVHEQWWRRCHRQLKVDRGPWPDASSYYLTAAKIELARLDHSESYDVAMGRLPYLATDLYTKLIKVYMRTIPVLLKMFPEELSRPTIWHPDINDRNLLVTTEPDIKICGIIDWRNAIVGPYFSQSVISRDFVYAGNLLPIPEEIEIPKELPDMSGRTLEEQNTLLGHYLLLFRYKAYQWLIANNDRRRAFTAISVPRAWELDILPLLVLGSDRESTFRLFDALMSIRDDWDMIPTLAGEPCPIEFSADELNALCEGTLRWTVYNHAVRKLAERLHAGVDGLVSHKDYANVKAECDRLRDEWDEEDNCGPFPYQDGMFSFYIS
ncbi:hypothetical protein GLOTRDRAFT_46606 [Gloeophyllum trabeum ATCC 11539]|uniref:Altered inheritance of mitochondria protein 9, mitochondrial n=1 Tax=Gloeophyllum trabeum (strain ATCC 11539 / FP-39264 / Madison 617) TaxID=670483 RepID=S7PYV1_GLOTA|nr:uncharacterized protein GLOTRDRAFT_46606 [Gloeophyllum trabeum ATCC 11539]EPQ52638.1 hypothetical protein GLOTRDRAFT_46606 [Gloeophyllum trabeum ATCC 11539]